MPSIKIIFLDGLVKIQQGDEEKNLGHVDKLVSLKNHALIDELKMYGVTSSEDILFVRDRLQRNAIFGKPKMSRHRLGQGVFDDNFYYGTEVEKDGKPYSCIITSDGTEKNHFVGYKEDNQIKNDFGLNYFSDFDEDALTHNWSNEAIEKTLNGDYKPIDLKGLLDRQRALWQKFVFFTDEREYYFHVCAVLNSYCFTLFTHQPRIDFRGQTESGKSTATKLYKETAFNAIWVNKGSDAARFRDLEATCATLIIDNFDNLPTEIKDEICYFIEVSFDREGGTKRILESVGRNNFKGKTFRVYCPLVINSKDGYGVDSTQNRLISTTMEKHAMPKFDPKLPDWEEIRNESRRWVLDNWKKISEMYESLETGFAARSDDIYKPILVIAKMADSEYFEKIHSLLLEKEKLLKETQGEDDYEREILQIVLDQFGEKICEKICVPDIGEKFITQHYGYEPERDRPKFLSKRSWAGKKIKKVLRNIPILNKAERITRPQNRITFEIHKQEIIDYMTIRGYLQ